MNVTLKYLTNKHNFDVYQSSSLSYFYEIAAKVFQLHKGQIMLIYQNQKLPDDETIKVSNYFKELSSVSIQIKSIELKLPKVTKLSRNYLSTEKDSGLNRNCLSLTELTPLQNITSKSKRKKKKQEPIVIICQLCEKQASLFYCRSCNEFVCLECNTKYSEHIRHQLLHIENKNYEQTASVYQKDVIREINILENAYKKTIDWSNIEIVRASCLNSIVSKLKDIDEKAQTISSSKVSKQSELSEQLIYIIKDYVFQLINQKSKHKELQRVFSDLNKKEKEIIKLISYVNLEVIKAKYNYKLVSILKSILNMLNELVVLSTNTENDCALRNYLIEELNNFNDDYPMKPLDYFVATFDDSFLEGEDTSNLKQEVKQDNKPNKPLFSKFINPIEPPMNKTNTNTNTNSNANSTNPNIFLEYRHINSPHISSTKPNRKENFITPRMVIKRKNSKCLNSVNDMCKSGLYSPKKNALNIVFGETNQKLLQGNEMIDSSHVNPLEGIRHQKRRKSKLQYSSDLFF